MIKFLLFVVCCLTLSACNKEKSYDLIVRNASVFDSRTGMVQDNRTILIKEGIIKDVILNAENLSATEVLDAKGKLVTPGLIDTHIHPTDVFGDYDQAPLFLPKDSLLLFRQQLTDTYLPYGVTTAMIMGQPESWLELILQWSFDPSPEHLDLFTTGGALISEENRRPYVGHVEVGSPLDAKKKVIDYYNHGLKHVKLYWRLREPEFVSAFHAADSLGMKIYGHIDQGIMRIDGTLKVGLQTYEHVCTLANSLMSGNDWNMFSNEIANAYQGKPLSYQATYLEQFRYMDRTRPKDIDRLIDSLSKNKATFSTTFHLLAEPFGMAYFSNAEDTTLTQEEMERCQENFRVLMKYARKLTDKGVKIRLGTDCQDGGKAVLSELLLMYESGFTVSEVLQIATINGAEALGLNDKCGSIDKGKTANLLIWEEDPFDDYRNFVKGRTIIKDGIRYMGKEQGFHKLDRK